MCPSKTFFEYVGIPVADTGADVWVNTDPSPYQDLPAGT